MDLLSDNEAFSSIPPETIFFPRSPDAELFQFPGNYAFVILLLRLPSALSVLLFYF